MKATATRAALRGSPDAQFQEAFDFWSFTFDTNDRCPTSESRPIESYFLAKARIKKLFSENLQTRWGTITSNSEFMTHESETMNAFFCLARIPGIRKYHQSDVQRDGTLHCRTVSTSKTFDRP